jgi:hypothetical protein
LEPISSAILKERFDPAGFSEHGVYPDIWDEDPQSCMDEYVLHYFEKLKAFVRNAKSNQRGLIVYLN